MSERWKNCLSYWFPLVRDAGLPVPKTVILRTKGLLLMLYGEECEGVDTLLEEIRLAGKEVGLPFFLRTGHVSGKHNWESTCFVAEDDQESIYHHVRQLVETSELAHVMGLPSNVWVVREMIPTFAAFTAFAGNMPVTREFRLFVRDGVIEHEQFYWPQDALEDEVDEDRWPNWRSTLMLLAGMSLPERAELHALAKRASLAVPGYWSVDFLSDTRGKWWLIDMALGEDSYRWDSSRMGSTRTVIESDFGLLEVQEKPMSTAN